MNRLSLINGSLPTNPKENIKEAAYKPQINFKFNLTNMSIDKISQKSLKYLKK